MLARMPMLTMAVLLALLTVGGGVQAAAHSDAESEGCSPLAVVAHGDGQTLFVACETGHHIAVFDLLSNRVIREIDLPGAPSGVALSRDGNRLYVTCAAPTSRILILDVKQGSLLGLIPGGHTAMAPVLSPDGARLYVCNRFDGDISVIDLEKEEEVRRVKVSREPVAAALTPDGRFLLVANHLHHSVSDGPGVAAVVSVIDTGRLVLEKQIKLARGSGLLRGIAVSPDGRFAAVSHLLARYYLPTTDVEFGRINSNAISFLDLERMQFLRIVYLDQAKRGAANPWAVAWTPDGSRLVVSLAGVHELGLVEAPMRAQQPVLARERIPLPGLGPRAFALVGTRVYVAQYFSNDLAMIDLAAVDREAEQFQLGPAREDSIVREGEMRFNDARICFQGWQSCASCHGTDGRMDGMNWDLLNDGTGNPKNVKSLVWAHQTPPAMALGVRSSAEVAVRAGIRHILFTDPLEAIAEAMDAFLKSLQPVPSPHLVNGELSESAVRGRDLFHSSQVGCAGCHVPPLFTNLGSFNVGTRGRYDRAEDPDPFDTPALVELWRTAPYLHDGSAATLRDVFSTLNPRDCHGTTSHLSQEDLADLEAYLLSL
jgi:YVTN family beta-propeller protein